jgi:hypothetical protein
MFNSDTELFFPIRVIPTLNEIRGEEWIALVNRVSSEESSELEKIAFSDLIIKMAGCQACDADSFRAMRGCTQCAKMIVKRFKGSDAELVEQYEQCKRDVGEFLKKRS